MSEKYTAGELHNQEALDYLESMDVGEHVTVYCEDLDIKQNELVKTASGWEVYTGFGVVDVSWGTIREEVTEIA